MSDERPALPRLYAITDGARLGESALLDRLDAACRGGLAMIQLREKHLDDAAYGALWARVREHAPSDCLLAVNRRIDLVEELGSRAVHLGGDPESIAIARRRLPAEILIGYSAHAIDEIERVAELGADYVSFSPIYAPRSKRSAIPPVGIEALRVAVERSPIPVYALGGIDPRNVVDVARTGAHGVAVIGSVLDAPNPGRAVAAILDALN